MLTMTLTVSVLEATPRSHSYQWLLVLGKCGFGVGKRTTNLWLLESFHLYKIFTKSCNGHVTTDSCT